MQYQYCNSQNAYEPTVCQAGHYCTRKAAWKPFQRERLAGALEKYAKLVGPTHLGAVTHSGNTSWPYPPAEKPT